MGASIRPSDHIGEPQPLNINDKKLMGSIHEHPLEWLVANYMAPPADPNSYFDIHNIPTVWGDCVSKFPARHLFLYSFCLASADKLLGRLKDARDTAAEMCRRGSNEPGMTWLGRRPQYALHMDGLGVRKHYPAWSWEIKLQTTGLAERYGVKGKLLLVVYSSKAMLGSGVDLSGWRAALDDEAKMWDEYVAGEGAKIRRQFGIKDTL